ncbi:MAG TPA: D-amino acid dehydrogenase [Burkholderiales bacterium]|nr:D-amino acid dehydrogenase [Burkholderiales bacterium]
MKVIVLGAGVVGTAAAWYLRAAGHEVQVLERRSAAGMETSFANGGQISASHALPWAAPGVPWTALKWMLREDAPLLFRLRADPAQWRWGLRFLRECTAERFRANAAQLQRLGRYSRDALHELQRATGIHYDEVRRGILVFFTDKSNKTIPGRIKKTPEECLAIEPALAHARGQLLGGEFLDDDESGDAHKFTTELAKRCVETGVRFDFGVEIEGFEFNSEKIFKVKAKEKTFAADAYVLALGSYSPLLARPLGLDLAIYPLKGYSITMPVKDPAKAWTTSLTDEAHKLVYSRLGDRLRIAGTAEMNGYNTEVNAVRCRAIVERVHELFPGAGDETQVKYWTGLRPATPTNIPYIGRTRYANLFLDTGHGTLGWTHACGSGKAIAEIVSGRRPELDFAFC